jgi:GGDEF domain-containing protein
MSLLDSNELGLMLSNTNSNQTVALLERIQQQFQQSELSQDQPGTNQQTQDQTLPLFEQSVPSVEESTKLLARAGIAEFPVDGDTPDDLINTARKNAQLNDISFKIFG